MLWKREWFPRIPIFGRSYWDSDENSKKFLDSLAMQYNLQDLGDWRRVSVALIKSKGGRVNATQCYC